MDPNRITKLMGPALLIFSQVAANAHPGHYHPPGEGDEFDSLSAGWLHLHGWLEISLAFVAVGSVTLFRLSRQRGVRLGAALAFGGSIAFIAAS